MADQSKYNRLVSKRVLIIGGTSGLGFAGAEASLENGAIVIVSSSNPTRVESAVSRLQSSYPSRKEHISGFVCNLGDDDTLESNIVQLLKQSTDNGQKKLDHIIFTAADPLAVTKIQDFSLKKMHDAGRIRFFAPMLLAKHTPEYMNFRRESSFTITTGGIAERPNPDWTVIAAYAGGHGSMARNLAIDLAPLRFNCVSPGLVQSDLWSGMDEKDREALYKNNAESVPTGVSAVPEDIAEAYLYFMKDYNVTGTVLRTDSGHFLV